MTIEKEIVGIITIQFEPEGSYFRYINNEEKYLTCHRIAIKNGFTQKGYAINLLKFAEDLALKRKIKKTSAATVVQISLYEFWWLDLSH